jgi:antirestriction protein ArdC
MSDDTERQPRSEHERRDLYKNVTAKILRLMEQGINPFAPDWDGSKCPATPRPRNAVTGDRYSGINELLLGAQPDPRYATFKQARGKGWHILSGEHGTPIIFFDRKAVTNKNRQSNEDPEKIVLPIARTYSVFHVSQMRDANGQPIPPWEPPTLEEAPWQAPESIEQIIAGAKADGMQFLEQGDRAFYSPSRDTVVTPPKGAFISRDRWASVLLHETCHGSGHPSRLARAYGKRFGDSAYAFEELCSEAGAAYASAELGLSRGEEALQHAAGYLSGWAKVLAQDPKAIFTACARGAEAAEWVLKRIPAYREAEEAKAERKAATAVTQVETAAKVYLLHGIDRENKDSVKAEFPAGTLRWNRAATAWEVRADDPSVLAVVSKYGSQAARDELAVAIDAENARKQTAATSTDSMPTAPPPRPIVATGVAAYGQMPKHVARRLGMETKEADLPAPPPPVPEEAATMAYRR